ncbi:PLC-like phosphodiesterase [Mrakia frigida]|uniref:PLC-like phosphodiesterase n=1 Tax=Mrakia frigida TaxID=29902 RepID=UPI003FCBFF2C
MNQSKRSSHLPECWAHRGASKEFPENTLAAFEGAIAEGSEAIESDLHCTTDSRILLFHDVSLERTTNGKGLIKDLAWEGGIEHVRTKAEPIQPIPLFEELLTLLMKEGNRTVRFNIDVKPTNDPERLFGLMAIQIRKFPNWETELAPRLILGLWHPAFIIPAQTLLPGLTIHNITPSLSLAQSHFFPHVSGFSVAFPLLVSPAGQEFLKKCRKAGKEVGVWTVNDEAEMCMSARWGVDWVLTDRPVVWRKLREELSTDFDATFARNVSPLFSWSSIRYFSLPLAYWNQVVRKRLVAARGPFQLVPVHEPREGKTHAPTETTPVGL